MSDPFSITGSAVGVISLGLSVCGEIARYARNVQGQTDDMKHLATKATNIRSLLRGLDGLIDETRSDSPEVAADLESKALGLQVYLDRLKRPIDQFNEAQVATTSVRSRARSTLNKAMYHFKKEELFEVRDCLHSMELDLTTALNVYSARAVHQFGLKQDLLLEKMDTLQLSITATSHQTFFHEQTTHSISCRGNFSVQSCRPSLGFNWKNLRTTQERKQYRLYSRWLGRAFTATFCFSTEPGVFPIASLHCHAVVDSKNWLDTFDHERRIFERPGLPDLTARELSEEVDNWIPLLQRAAEEGKMRLSDEIFLYESSLSAMDFTFYFLVPFNLDTFPGIRKFVTYMLDHNVTTNYRNASSPLRMLCHAYIWTEQELDLASYIIEKCGPINWAPRSWIEKINMQCLLRRHDDSIDLPSEFLAVLRESETDLQGLLESKLAPSKDSLNGITLIQVAMGWPVGVKLLMKAQPGIRIPESYHAGSGINDEETKIDEYVECSNILLGTGYRISNFDIVYNSSNMVRSIFIQELAKRRRKLLDIAEAHIHPGELCDLRKGETGLPDAYATALWAALISKGHEMDQSLRPFEERSLFCGYDISPVSLDKIYEAGFIDFDLPLEGEYTPLMGHCAYIYGYTDLERIAWMISKGASIFRTLPGSNSTTLHLLNSKLARWIHRGCGQNDRLDPHVRLRHLQQIETHLLSLSTRDRCYCSCSADGCTPFSVAMRDVIFGLHLGRERNISQAASSFRWFLEIMIDHNQSKLEVCHAIIRNLTFDGLSLSHTCCTEIRWFPPWKHVRDESDLQEIREEQTVPLERFEKLVSEFDAQFDALGLPLMDFLQEIWYERMIKFLSERDKYDLEHNEETRKLGISLEVDEIEIPLVVQYICDQVRVVESDCEDS